MPPGRKENTKFLWKYDFGDDQEPWFPRAINRRLVTLAQGLTISSCQTSIDGRTGIQTQFHTSFVDHVWTGELAIFWAEFEPIEHGKRRHERTQEGATTGREAQ